MPYVRDVDHNRSGRLAPAQAAVIRKLQVTSMLIYLGVPLIGLQVGGAALMGAFQAGSIVLGVLVGAAGVAILVGTVLACVYRWRRQGRLAHENVTFVDGRVAWAGTPRTWTPIAAGGAPLPALAGGPMLPPGPFRFYLHEDRIVAAESPLDATTYWSITQSSSSLFDPSAGSVQLPPAPFPVGDPEALRTVLADAMGFTHDDLDHYRRGELPHRMGAGRVVSVDGPLAIGWTMHSKVSVTYRWEVADRRFEVPLAWLQAAPPGVLYRCYVEERSQRLLGLEPLGR
jgi:hypothetical protein